MRERKMKSTKTIIYEPRMDCYKWKNLDGDIQVIPSRICAIIIKRGSGKKNERKR